MIYRKIKRCRICGNSNLKTVIDLGILALTGVFPYKDETVNSGPLELVKCSTFKNSNVCGLLQLKHDYDLSKLYGDNYGYRSGLNDSMVKHLGLIVNEVHKLTRLENNDLVIDIGSNDGTLLKAYKNKKLKLVGIDPTIKKFARFYPPHISCIPDFFSAGKIRRLFKQKAKVITSIAMIYDLENPTDFFKQISEILLDNGIWVTEQSYLPEMIKNMAYDTICHEHLEYYTLKNLKWIADNVGLKIIKIDINDVNGASFCISFAKKDSRYKEDITGINKILKEEDEQEIDSMDYYKRFFQKIKSQNYQLVEFVQKVNKEGKLILGYGASTKGSVILQTCKMTKRDLPYIAEVNEYKFGRLAPGTDIPIISENEAKKMKPDFFLVFPWHFKENIIQREKGYLRTGGHLVFPLPKLEII